MDAGMNICTGHALRAALLAAHEGQTFLQFLTQLVHRLPRLECISTHYANTDYCRSHYSSIPTAARLMKALLSRARCASDWLIGRLSTSYLLRLNLL